MTDEAIQIPYEFSPRDYQGNVFRLFGYGRPFQFASLVWHRRAGKDKTGLAITSDEMFKRVGTYWHLFPQHNQARKAIWEGMSDGKRIINQFLPPAVRTRTSSQEMSIRVQHPSGDPNLDGSFWQMAGSDNYDSLVGSNVVGVVFTEWALCQPDAWAYIRPMIDENGGWALFITTPRGRNHAYKTHLHALKDADWYAETLTVDDTGVISQEALDRSRRDPNMSEARFLQEWYCSFDADTENQFIGNAVVEAAEKREPHAEMTDPLILGVDVARFGDDKTVLFPRRGRDARTIPMEIYGKQDTMTTAAKVAEFNEKHKPDAIFVDVGGIGAGVVDRLVQLGVDAQGINFGGESDFRPEGVGRSHNKRTEMWATMREWLKLGAIPEHELLSFELTAPMYKYDTDNAYVLEKKEEMKKRQVPSPDIADGLALTFAYPVQQRVTDAERGPGDDYQPFGGMLG